MGTLENEGESKPCDYSEKNTENDGNGNTDKFTDSGGTAPGRVGERREKDDDEHIDKEYSFGDVDENTVGVFKLAPSDAEVYEDVPELIVGEKAEISFAEPAVSVNYKGTSKLEPAIKVEDGVDYTVKYESSNPDVATVDDEGNITTTGRGNATITCTVTDEKGIETQETVDVDVQYSFLQWIIRIFLLGFLWY